MWGHREGVCAGILKRQVTRERPGPPNLHGLARQLKAVQLHSRGAWNPFISLEFDCGLLVPALDGALAGYRLGQLLQPLFLARQRTEGGAPPLLYERGAPQYPPLPADTPDTYPLAVACC